MSNESDDGARLSRVAPPRRENVRQRLEATQRGAPGVDETAARENPRDEGPRLHRKRRTNHDPRWVDPKVIPAGWEYNWKRASTLGAPDQANINEATENHWSPVPEGRHPGLLVRQAGLVLMERPVYLCDEAREEEYETAAQQNDGAVAMLTDSPAGHFDRASSPMAQANTFVKTAYGVAIPE